MVAVANNFFTENNRTIPVSFSASHAFHNGFVEWSKKIFSPFVGTAAGPFNGQHFFSGKMPFIFSSILSEKRYRWSFYWGKRAKSLIRSIQFPKCQSLDFIYRTKKHARILSIRCGWKVPLPPIDGGN